MKKARRFRDIAVEKMGGERFARIERESTPFRRWPRANELIVELHIKRGHMLKPLLTLALLMGPAERRDFFALLTQSRIKPKGKPRAR